MAVGSCHGAQRTTDPAIQQKDGSTDAMTGLSDDDKNSDRTRPERGDESVANPEVEP